jgi:hypothetical protein
MKTFFTRLALILSVSVPVFAFAASPFLKPVKDLLGDLEVFIQFLGTALPAVAILLFFLLIIVFIADKMKFPLPFGLTLGEKAGKNVLWSIVALAVMVSVYGLIQLVGALFGVDTNRAKTITAPSLPSVGGVRGGGYYNQ